MDIVLVHGGWHGGWCWRRVEDLLRVRGHRVFAPSLTGLAERSHLLSGDVNLSTHITDVANLLRWEGLSEVVLVGHSYGGMVITGVAEQAAGQIADLVFLDALIPQQGQCLVDLMSPALSEQYRGFAARGEFGLPPIPATHFNVNAADMAWVNQQCTPQPVNSFLQPCGPTGVRDGMDRPTYIRAADYPSPGLDKMLDLAKASGWAVHSIGGGHDLMLDNPQGVADILAGLASRGH